MAAAIALSRVEAESREAEGQAAETLVGAVVASLTETDPTFNSCFNPARDGNCLPNCSLEHDARRNGQPGGAAEDAARAALAGECLPSDTLRAVVLAQVRETAMAKLAVSVTAVEWPTTVVALEGRLEVMSRPGVVMGEEEIQALADVRGGCVEVHESC